MDGKSWQDEPLLEAPEIGPVADTLSLYDAVKRMRPVPVGKTSFFSVLVPAIVPMIVVIAMRVPIKEHAAHPAQGAHLSLGGRHYFGR